MSVLDNDTDGDTDTLTASVGTPPTHGVLSLNADGTGTFTPTAGYSGTDSFTYSISDGHGGSDTATVQLLIDGPPVAVDDSAATPGATAVDIAVLGNDTDPDTDPLVVSATTAPADGAIVVLADWSIRYTPNAGFAGDDTFTYTVSDGRGLTDTATVTVTVANAAPVANPDAVGTATDTPASGVDVLANDTDVNVAAGVPGQALVVSGTPTADNGATVVVNADGTLTVTPATGFTGVITVTYTLADGAGGTDTGVLNVTVDNAAPVAVPDGPVSTPTDTSVLVDVTANDTDPNPGDTLTIAPGSISAPVDGGGTTRGTAVIESGEIRYTPPAGYAGTVTFTYAVSDGNGGTSTGTATVVVQNAPPVADDDTVSTATDTPTTVDVLDGDTDPNVPGTTQVAGRHRRERRQRRDRVVNADGTLTVTPAPASPASSPSPTRSPTAPAAPTPVCSTSRSTTPHLSRSPTVRSARPPTPRYWSTSQPTTPTRTPVTR